MGTESNGNSFYMENGMGMENFYSVQSMLGNANNSHTNNSNNGTNNNGNGNVVADSNGNGSGNRWSNLLTPRDTNEQQQQQQQVHNTPSNVSNNFASHQRNFLNYGTMACYQRIYNENGFNLSSNAQNYHQYHNSTHQHQHQQPKQYYSSGLKNVIQFYRYLIRYFLYRNKFAIILISLRIE